MSNTGFQQKLQKVAGKISSNRYLKAVSDGLMSVVAVLIIGAFSTLLSEMAIEPYQNFITNIGIKGLLEIPAQYTTEMVALYAVFFIAFKLAGSFEKEGSSAGLIALMSFLVLTPTTMLEEDPVLPFQFLGAQGLFVAIIVGLVSARLYVLIVNKGLTIKMPAGVPPTVSKTFIGLVPAIIIVIFFTIISFLFTFTPFGNMHEFVYSFIQAPMQNLGGGFWSLIAFTLVVHGLWLLGIHGMLVVLPIYLSIWMPLGVENLDALAAGEELPNIVNTGFAHVFMMLGGSGATLGLAIIMAFLARSKRYKTLGKIALPGSFFGINEPLLFGLPIVLNPYLAVPFVVAPLVSVTIPYFLMSTGIIARTAGAHLPLGTPTFFNAVVQGGVVLLIVQIIMIIVTGLIYYPFFRVLDKQALEQEKSAE
ncbi:PTS system, cellobiose-specific IIC component [Pelagirhabdus alkalitolerans]|uniref:Permease IIC component n=1 Tax=Pelagirhabdus alkalitolerans TaxID=1612202 RepID=A0A1G6KKL3_9BACI|nr:PTS transporter subunit EIIC [Pelagirhabdus alkalitolerans]SDC31503.1 PTS system, cellobiose-specific IIC component [Pelagirhabdus alkalitolerans]